MAARFSPGRSIGRVSIRVVPDSTRFRQDLKPKLERIAKTTSMTVRVDKAKLDNAQIRESIRRQMSEFKGLDIDANVRIEVSKVRLRKAQLRASIQEQFDKFEDIRVGIKAEVTHVREFEKQVKDLADRASRNKVQIPVNAHTAAAAAQMRYTTRPRTIEIFVKLNKTALAKTMTTLAALSGARLTWKWIDSLLEKARNLDKTLPAIIGWTSGITSLIAALAGSVGGLVGIGQGLFSITPALLVIPGLAMNALGSLTVLIVALKNSGTELAALKGDMSELGDIMNNGFWERARKPIVDLVSGLMPQLRVAFRDLSEGLGDFTAAMAKAFGEELADGRLEAIFKGISDGWRVLGTGASGFAGALVNLSTIAATYTPRLAGWFVRQANTFDAWLTAISTDGRLGAWMESAIDSMYDVWDVTRGIAGVFEGLYTAASAAGSTGLKGFAKMMLEWRRIVQGADFQRGLTAVFRGSYRAMEAFGGAVRAIGRLFVDMAPQIERFIGGVGGFFGGLIEGFAVALNNSNMKVGLNEFTTDLEHALEMIKPSLEPIAATFGNLVGFIGELARNVLPAAAGVIADLMPAVDGIIRAIAPILPGLTQALSDIGTHLGPAAADLVKALTPAFQDAMKGLSDAISRLAPTLAQFVTDAAPNLARSLQAFVDIAVQLMNWTADLANPYATGASGMLNPDFLWDNNKLDKISNSAVKGGGWWGDVMKWAQEFDTEFVKSWESINWDWNWDQTHNMSKKEGATSGSIFVGGFGMGMRQGGDALVTGADGVQRLVTSRFSGAAGWLTPAAIEMMTGFTDGMAAGDATVASYIADVTGRLVAGMNAGIPGMFGAGSGLMLAVTEGVASTQGSAVAAVLNNIRGVVNAAGSVRPEMVSIGASLMQGIIDGAGSVAGNLAAAMVNNVRTAVRQTEIAMKIFSPSRVTRDRLGAPLGQGIAVGVLAQKKSIVAAYRTVTELPSIGVGNATGPGIRDTSATATGAAFINNGTILTQSPEEFADMVEKRRRRGSVRLSTTVGVLP